MKDDKKVHNSRYDAIRLSRRVMWEEENELVSSAKQTEEGGYDFGNDEDNYLVEEAIELLTEYPCLRYSLDSYVDIIKEDIIGQDEAVKNLVFVACLNQNMNFCEEFSGIYQGKRNTLLLIAPTGNGKTALMRSFESVFDVPVYIANITATTSSGYVGENVEDMLIALYEKADCDLHRAERGVLFIDEIDKKAVTVGASERDVAGRAVQQELLKILEPGTINLNISKRGKSGGSETIRFCTDNLTVVLGGAFVGLSEIRKKRLHKKQIGFREVKEDYTETEYTHEDLINYGFIPEFVGRIDIISEFRKLTAQDIVDIIYSPNSAMQQKISMLDLLHVERVEIDPLLWEKMAAIVENDAMGIRTLNQMILKLFKPILYIALQHPYRGSCRIDEFGNFTLKYEGSSQVYSGCGLDLREEISSEF